MCQNIAPIAWRGFEIGFKHDWAGAKVVPSPFFAALAEQCGKLSALLPLEWGASEDETQALRIVSGDEVNV